MHIIWKSGLIPFRLYQRKYLLSTPSPLHMISIDAKDILSLLQTVKSIRKLLQRRQLKQFLSYFMLFTVTFSYFYLPVSFPILRTGPVSLLPSEIHPERMYKPFAVLDYNLSTTHIASLLSVLHLPFPPADNGVVSANV